MLLDDALLEVLKSCCKDDDAFGRARTLFESQVAKSNESEATLQHTIDVLQGEVRERLKLEADLAAQEHFYRTMFENANIGLAFKKHDKIERANQVYLEMLGYAADELSQRTLTDITHSDDLPQQQALDAQLERGEISHYTLVKRYLRKDGSTVWAETHVSALHDTTGALISLVAARDITQERLTQEKIQQSEAQLTWLLNALPFAIAIYKNQAPIFGNRVFFESRGLRDLNHWLEAKAQEPINDDYALIHPDDYNDFIANLDDYRQRVDSGELLKVERRIRRYQESNYIWYDCSILKGTYIDGEKVIVEADVSIQARKEAELMLKQSQAMLSDTEQLLNIGSWSFDVERQTIDWSDGTYRLYERDKAQGMPTFADIFQATPSQYHTLLQTAIDEAISQQKHYAIAFPILTASGTEKWLRAVGQPLTDAQGKVIKLYGYVIDITEQKRLEVEKEALYQQLLQSQKLESIGVLASGIAHEFNNILTGILGFASLLHKEVAGNANGEKRVAQIETASLRAATIVKQMLGFARQGKMQVQAIDLRDCVHSIISMVEPTLDKRIRLTTDFRVDERSCVMNGDKGQLEQVILNLVVNARDALMEKLSEIAHAEISFTLTCEPLPKSFVVDVPSGSPFFICLTVRDNGIGIPKDIQEKIFEPFFTTKEVGKGTGLGLSMVYGIVKNHQGFIAVESEVGKGTAFRLYFPLSDAHIGQQPSADTADVRGGINATILVVDDEPFIREFLTELLEGNGYSVYTASNGAEGLAFFEAHQDDIDLAIIDKNMPERSGEELLLKLNSLRPKLRVILMTGFLENEVVAALMQKGAYQVLIKPFEPTQLLSAVASALQ
jgi:PAS domain S-box-containing protein